MAQIARLLLLAFALLLANAPTARAAIEPRVVIGVYADKENPLGGNQRIFRAAEMPLNHLGLILEAHNALSGVPDLGQREDVRGVLIWLQTALPAPERVLGLIDAAVRRKIPVVIFEQAPGGERSLGLIGVRTLGFRPYTFDTKIASSDKMVGFERPFTGALPASDVIVPIDEGQSLLTLQREDGTRSHPMLITPKGAYIAPDYPLWGEKSGDRALWRIDPFAFFARVFKTAGLPKPDATTLSGRRIYYSQIDGDGWLNVSQVSGYAQRRALSSEVVWKETILPFPDLPVTVAPIAADLDPKMGGTTESQSVARALFALPQVEAGSHTYTHPFQWSYFAPDKYSAANELQYKARYGRAIYVDPGTEAGDGTNSVELEDTYATPRAFGDIPFNVNKEIAGAANFISSFAPQGKQVRVVQWSGDTTPFKEALAAAREAGLANINGGDTRKDNAFPSHTTVAPLGRADGGERQIYSSGANENLYTGNWTRNFGAFRQMLITAQNTGSPRRLAPVNLYYHMYSGEREASLAALKTSLAAISKMNLAPVSTARYTEIARGFYDVQLENEGPFIWRIRNRGSLATIRFDNASLLSVDYAKSQGILGDRHEGDALYVALDSAHAQPLIALKSGRATPVSRLVLRDARWEIWSLMQAGATAEFSARGFGPGDMRFLTEPGARWRVEVGYKTGVAAKEFRADGNGFLSIVMPRGAEEGVQVRMTRQEERGA